MGRAYRGFLAGVVLGAAALSGCSLLPQATPAPDDASASADGTPSTAFTLQVQAPAPAPTWSPRTACGALR